MSLNMNKKVIAAAVGGLFVATGASATVTISDTTPVPITVASELVVPGPGLTITNAANRLDLATQLKYAFSALEVRHARIECDATVRFNAGSTVAAPTALVGAINGLGTNAIHFSITAPPAGVPANEVITVLGNRTILATTPASCTYGLYDQPSEAASGGPNGLIASATGPYMTFAQSYRLAITTRSGATADVEASPSFTAFVIPGNPTGSGARAQLGRALFANRNTVSSILGEVPTQAQPILANGNFADTSILLAATSTHTVTGDLSAAANSNGTFTGAALNRVFVSGNADCSTVDIPATSVSATAATFQLGSTQFWAYLCYTPRAGVAIPASEYTHSFTAVSAAPTTYTVSGISPLELGPITRNGTSLQAPLAQVPTGWISRMVLTNTGSVARAYTIEVSGETGNTIGTANLTGTIPANGTTVVELPTVLTSFTGSPRATLNVTVAGPNAQIQGLYQIVNPTSLTISNHVMVRPGTN